MRSLEVHKHNIAASSFSGLQSMVIAMLPLLPSQSRYQVLFLRFHGNITSESTWREIASRLFYTAFTRHRD
jgi:hypothetical protein